MSNNAATGLGLFIDMIICLVWLAVIAFQIFLCWRIFGRTGQHGALGLLGLIPWVGLLIVLCVLAFSTWPLELERNQLRMMLGGMAPPAPGYGQPMPPQATGYGQPMPPAYNQPPSQYPPSSPQ